ncbi:MAG: S9 family peptidase [Gemmatimonadales bacterium]
MTDTAPLAPPLAPRRPRVLEIHGERSVDEYFWLRNREDPDVRAYLEAENAYADVVLAPTRELQEVLYGEMLGRIKQTDLSVPYRYRGWWYYSRTEEGKQYAISCRKRSSLEAAEEILLDLNVLAAGRSHMALGAFEVSDDGRFLAYSSDPTGYREYLLVVLDLETGRVIAGPIQGVGSVAWCPDNRTLFHTVEDEAKRQYQLWRLEIGGAHTLVRQEDDARFRVHVERTRSGRHLILSTDSHTTSEVHWLPADQPAGAWRSIAGRVPDREYDVEHAGDGWIIRVNDTGPNFRVVHAPEAEPGPDAWVELLPHRDDVMVEGIEAFAEHWVAWERRQGLPAIRITTHAANIARYVAFPEPVYEAYPGANLEWDTGVFRYGYESPVTPSSVYDYDVRSGTSVLLKRREVLGGFDPARYGCDRLTITAEDGAPIPVTILFSRTPPPARPGPLLLTGYGAYGLSVPVSFSSNRLSLLDRGTVIAIAHVRGGGEMGRRWHDAGRMANKENTFADFERVAETLIADGWTTPERLVIEGASAGGLLVGAAVNRRPDLFGAVVAQVPFLDVLNTMLDPSLPLTVGEYEEWGNPRMPEQYAWLRRYCPYTNLAARSYPAMLVRTSLNDSQVMYWEPAKYVARLRTLKTDAHPVLLVTNLGAGHGGASGRYDRLREIALDYAFVLWRSGAWSPA